MVKKTSTKEITKAPEFTFFNDIKTGDKYSDAGIEHETYGCVDSGSYALNALLSGDIFGGFPLNRFVMVAGEQGSGKSYLGKNCFCKPLLDEGYFIFYIETEGETDEKSLISEFGFPEGQFRLLRVSTVEDCLIEINRILVALEADKGKEFKNKRKCAIVLDSQGNLSTKKIFTDAVKGELKADMTKAKILKGMYSLITLRATDLGVPMYVTNHIYFDPGAMFSDPKKIAGGEGGKYNCSIILNCSKTYEKTKDKEILGVLLKFGVFKSRITREKWSVPIYLNYKKGINKYYGLHTFALDANLIAEYSSKLFPDVIVPVDSEGKKVKSKMYVIKDPKLESKDWIVCLEGQIHRKDTIGTILDEINLYVKDTYKLKSPTRINYNDTDAEDITEPPEDIAEEAVIVSELREEIENSISNE